MRLEQVRSSTSQQCQVPPTDAPMGRSPALESFTEGYNIGTPLTGSTGSLQPRETVGDYDLALPSISGRGRRSSPRTPGSPRVTRAEPRDRRGTRGDNAWIQQASGSASQNWIPQKAALVDELGRLRVTNEHQPRQLALTIERSRVFEESLEFSARDLRITREQAARDQRELEQAY